MTTTKLLYSHSVHGTRVFSKLVCLDREIKKFEDVPSELREEILTEYREACNLKKGGEFIVRVLCKGFERKIWSQTVDNIFNYNPSPRRGLCH